MNVTADASDNIGVAGVQFLVDGVNVGVEDATPPYALAWDTRTVSNGAHTLTARARDAAGNSTLSAPVPVNVANSSSFQNEILATGFNLPTSIEFLPDGRMLVVELPGTIKVLRPPYTSAIPTPFLQLTNVGIDGYAGLQQGIFDDRPRPELRDQSLLLRLLHGRARRTVTGSHGSRPTPRSPARSPAARSSSTRIRRPPNTEHHGGAIVFGNDGKLYFTTGEHFQGSPSQIADEPAREDPSHQSGRDGSDRQPVLRRQRAERRLDLGARAAQSVPRLLRRTDWQALRRRRRRQRQLDRARGGRPRRRGRELRLAELRRARAATRPTPSPLYSYPHNGRDASITGGFVYHGTQFPSSYQGSYFFADYTQNWIKRMTFDASGNVTGVFNFEPLDGSLDGPYGDIVYLTEGPGRSALLRRPRLLRHRRHLRRQQDPPDPLFERQPGADRGRGGESDRWAGAARRQLLERGLVGSRGPAAHVRVDVRGRRARRRRQTRPTRTRSRASTRRGSRSRTA